MTLKIRATITININAKDYTEAAEIQKGIKSYTEQLSEKFESAEYDFKERRDRGDKNAKK